MAKSMTSRVLYNQAPSFTEMKAIYYYFWWKRRKLSHLSKLQFAAMIDTQVIVYRNKKQFLKLCENILNKTAKRKHRDLDARYKQWRFTVYIWVDWWEICSLTRKNKKWKEFDLFYCETDDWNIQLKKFLKTFKKDLSQ